MARSEFPAKIKTEALRRCAKKTGFPACEMCGVMLKHGRYEFDHRIPCALGGEATLENCVVACTQCHSSKTHGKDRPAINKAVRLERKHMGTKTTSYRPLPGTIASGIKRGFDGRVTRRD